MDYYFLGAAAGGVLTDYYFWAAGRTRAPAPEGTANQPCGMYRAPPQQFFQDSLRHLPLEIIDSQWVFRIP